MERSTYSLTYKGSIPDAINEAKKQKKLFVVYISGEDENSLHMEQSTWTDQEVAEVMSRCCIFLHLIHGNVDASQFSAIYPQKSFPSISAIGINGVLLWHNEGYITAKILKESIEKAWAALHLQETAATLLTAALASKTPGSAGSSSNVAPPTHGSSSISVIQPTSSHEATHAEDNPITDSDKLEDQRHEPSEDKDPNPLGHDSPLSEDGMGVKIGEEEMSASLGNSGENVIIHHIPSDLHSSTPINGDDPPLQQEKAKSDINHAKNLPESTAVITKNSGLSPDASVAAEERLPAHDVRTYSSIPKSNDIHVNIRMPNGSSIQIKLTKADALRSVKDFVDENQSSGVGSYDLAVPYPRKLFTEQDMSRTLSELGFASREALIVVPHRQPSIPTRSQPISEGSSNSTVNADHGNGSSGGYFDYAKRILSYLNPFSYFNGNAQSSSSEAGEDDDGPWQYSLNPSLQSRFAEAEASRRPFLSDQRSQPQNDNATNNTRRSTAGQFGGNIHTLRNYEHDQDPSGDRNMFWNGNSTQFGGDDKK